MRLVYKITEECLVKEFMVKIKLSRRFSKKVKLYWKIYINNVEAKNYYPLKPGDELVLEYNEGSNESIVSTENNLDIQYEDDNILIINKPISLASQPSHLHFENNVVSYTKSYFDKIGLDSNVHVVNRLDYQTSGLMCIAKNGFAHFELTKEKVITRKYFCVVEGILECKEGKIIKGIKREQEASIKRIACDDGSVAITNYKVICEKDNRSLIDVELETGRTHQIRVHFSYLNHPLVGDKIYGQEDERLMLHCYNVKFINPFTNKEVNVVCYPDFYYHFLNTNK